MQSVSDEARMKRRHSGRTQRRAEPGGRDTLMMELRVAEQSGWWERGGVDCSILAAAFLCLLVLLRTGPSRVERLKVPAFVCCSLPAAVLASFSVPYIHINIFQHIGLPMFSPTRRPRRIYQMSHGVLNLPRNPVLDWTFGHSLLSCHVEHHLFPFLSDHTCLKVKPVVSKYLAGKQLPYQQDSYLSRLSLFFHRYQELMVFAPPFTELVGVQ